MRRITLPGATDVVRFAENKIIMIAIECLEDCPVINTPLAQFSELFPDLPSTVVGVSRDGNLYIPHSADQLIAGDLAYVVTTKDQVRRTLGLFGHEEQEATRIVIAGGGNIGLYVARTIEQRQSRTKVKIIERNRERAISIADQLRRTVVLNGSALDQKLLLEADIQDADLMVAAHQQRPGEHPVERDGQTAWLQVQSDAHQQSGLSGYHQDRSASTLTSIRGQ